MDNVKIQTTQNVHIEYQLASVGDRILATLLDYLFFIAYVFFVGIIAGLANSVTDRMGIGLGLIMVLPIVFYDLLCELFFQGKSFGKMIMKIQVVKLDGTQPGLGSYLLRWILRIVDTRLFMGLVAVITIIINGKGQRIGDIAASTTVIKLKQKANLNDTILKKVNPDYKIVFPEVSRFSDHDITIIKEVLEFSNRSNNSSALDKVAEKAKQTMGISTQLPTKQFIETIIADYNYFHLEK